MNNILQAQVNDLLEFASIIIVAIDVNETVTFINKNGCTLLDSEKEKVIGLNWFDNFVPEEDRTQTRKDFTALLQGKSGTTTNNENDIIGYNGKTRRIHWHNITIKNEEGQITGILSSGEDVTEKRILLNRLSQVEAQKGRQLIEAQEKERVEIANELHDNVNQILATCKLLLEHEIHGQNISPFIQKTFQYIQLAIVEIRNISHRLNPVHFETLGLKAAIEELVQNINSATKVKVQLVISGQENIKKLDVIIALSVYRIIQEQFNNILKYAHATEVDLLMDIDKVAIDMEIKDNGKGFNLAEPNRGSGLKNIQNRVAFLQGKVYINTFPNEGCTLSVHIPYVQKQMA